MMQLSREERMLHIGKMTNVRDLGGYETQEGYYTKSHKFVRSTCPSGISDDLKEKFYDYGIRTVIDLRSDYELVHQPHSLKDYKDMEYYHINLLQNENMSVLPDDIKDYQDLSGFYIFMIEANKKQFKKVFETLLNHPYDCTLFNCSAGKDRTGVLACLLLDLAGCHEYDIVKDYSESYENNMKMMKQLEEMLPKEEEKFLGSDPRVMMRFLAYLREQYGSSKGYLLNIGFSDEEIEEIKENFII